jgi:hypothetical protein
MMKSKLVISFVHWSRWASSLSSPPQHQLEQESNNQAPRRLEKPAMATQNQRHSKDGDHRSQAPRWSSLLTIMELRKNGLEVGESIYSSFI